MSTSLGPTKGAEKAQAASGQWEARPGLARVLRFGIFAAPLLVSIIFTWSAGRIAPPESLGMNRWLWIAIVFVLANVLLAGLRKLTSRLVPLVALMKLTLVFPDHAPSRTKATLRQANSRRLLREIEEAKANGEDSSEIHYADYLVQLLKDVNDHDRLTRGHSERVRVYAEMIGEEIGLSDDEDRKEQSLNPPTAGGSHLGPDQPQHAEISLEAPHVEQEHKEEERHQVCKDEDEIEVAHEQLLGVSEGRGVAGLERLRSTGGNRGPRAAHVGETDRQSSEWFRNHHRMGRRVAIRPTGLRHVDRSPPIGAGLPGVEPTECLFPLRLLPLVQLSESPLPLFDVVDSRSDRVQAAEEEDDDGQRSHPRTRDAAPLEVEE